MFAAKSGLACEATCSVCWVGVVANRDADVFYTCDTLTYNKTSEDIIVITIMLNEKVDEKHEKPTPLFITKSLHNKSSTRRLHPKERTCSQESHQEQLQSIREIARAREHEMDNSEGASSKKRVSLV